MSVVTKSGVLISGREGRKDLLNNWNVVLEASFTTIGLCNCETSKLLF